MKPERKTEEIGGVKLEYDPSSDAAIGFVEAFRAAGQKYQEQTQHWIAYLRRVGIVAARPDDGWVHRHGEETVQMEMYPYFNDGYKEGSLVALGGPSKFRTVMLVKKKKTLFGEGAWEYREVHL